MRDFVVRCLRQRESRRIMMSYSQICQIGSCISFAGVVIRQKSQNWKRPAEQIVDEHDRGLAVRSCNICILACESRFLADPRSLPLKTV